ncbi:outer membrane protein assembly factor BamB family protein [Streptomyces violascens]|uniref:outer membrane protein assembly factor BamB family protein n=1 Tax=Streptomyces violascens TaxID=67381 RepID=UPI0036C0A275
MIGAGAWAWLGRPEGTTSDSTGATSPTASPAKPAWDLVWQVQTDNADPLIPPAPLVLDGLLLVGEYGVKGLDPATGKAKWSDSELWFRRRTATDGKKIYTVDYTSEETDPLTVSTVDPATGRIATRFSELKDLKAKLYGSQLLCATSETVFLAAGTGPDAETGFHKDQTWFLLAVDIRTGKKLWETPRPARPQASERLHFLSARAVGEYLVLVQQSADGALRLVVHEARTGTALWNRPLGGEQPPLSRAQLAVDGRHVYPAAGELVALGLSDGKEAWRFEGRTPGARFSPAAVDDGVVYAVEEGHGMVALDAASGTQRWAEKSRAVTAADLDVPPAVGVAYVYGKASSGLMAADIRTGAVARPFKAARARYFADPSAKRLIAIGDEYTAAYPLA